MPFGKGMLKAAQISENDQVWIFKLLRSLLIEKVALYDSPVFFKHFSINNNDTNNNNSDNS